MSTVPGPADRITEQLRHLCGVAVKTLPASGAGMSVVAKERAFALLTASDPVSDRLEELQFVLGEGPCVDAAAERGPVLVSDLAVDGPRRWPIYTPAVQDAGVCAIFAFPLQVGAMQLGVLDLYRAQPGPLTGPELAHAFALADEAVAILLDGQPSNTAAAGASWASMLAGPSELFQAQGMVMAQAGGTLAAAMARIRAFAYAENRRILDVARAVLAREIVFDRDE